MLNGKKTYTAAGAIVLLAAGAYLNGDLTWQQSVLNGLQGLAMIFLRMGMAGK